MFLEDCDPTLLCSTKAMQSTVDLSQTLGNARHTHRVPGSLITRSAGCSPLSTAPTCIPPSVSYTGEVCSASRDNHSHPYALSTRFQPMPSSSSLHQHSQKHPALLQRNRGGVRLPKAKLPSTGSIEDPSFQAPRTPSSTQPEAGPSLHDAVYSRLPSAQSMMSRA